MSYPACTVSPPLSPADREACHDLRWRRLRQPWQQPRGSELDDHETTAYLLMAKTPSGQVVGTGRLHTLDQQRGQIRYMAVESGFERQGIASAILTRLEEEARRLSLHEIVLHARDKAVGFYSRHGYADGGCAPATCDIPHQVMSKTLA